MPDLTTRFGFNKPKVNDAEDEDQWGDQLNENIDEYDELLEGNRIQAINASATTNIDLDDGVTIALAHGADIATLNITNWLTTKATYVHIMRTKDASGTARTITWPTITWVSGATEPTLTQTASATDQIILWSLNGGTTIYGAFAPA